MEDQTTRRRQNYAQQQSSLKTTDVRTPLTQCSLHAYRIVAMILKQRREISAQGRSATDLKRNLNHGMLVQKHSTAKKIETQDTLTNLSNKRLYKEQAILLPFEYKIPVRSFLVPTRQQRDVTTFHSTPSIVLDNQPPTLFENKILPNEN